MKIRFNQTPNGSYYFNLADLVSALEVSTSTATPRVVLENDSGMICPLPLTANQDMIIQDTIAELSREGIIVANIMQYFFTLALAPTNDPQAVSVFTLLLQKAQERDQDLLPLDDIDVDLLYNAPMPGLLSITDNQPKIKMATPLTELTCVAKSDDTTHSHRLRPKLRMRAESCEMDTESKKYADKKRLPKVCDLTNEADVRDRPFKELEEAWRLQNLPPDEISEIKAWRRKLKNRDSARVCSSKRRGQYEELLEEHHKLKDDYEQLEEKYNKLLQKNQDHTQSDPSLLKKKAGHHHKSRFFPYSVDSSKQLPKSHSHVTSKLDME